MPPPAEPEQVAKVHRKSIHKGAKMGQRPKSTLEKPVVDTDKSHVASRQRGIVNRIAGIFSDNPTSEQEMYHLAEKKLAAAAQHSKLVDRAERNTTAMLQGFLGKLGYTDVQVVFSSPAATT